MYVLTNKQMREADEYTVKTLDMPSLLLMERAGIALADEAERMTDGKIVCVCGGGNNGGDGFVCARVLKSRDRDVSVVFYAEKQSNDCRINMEKWQAVGGEILAEIPDDCDLIVDCLYGTGFRGALVDADMGTVNTINELKLQGVQVLAADIPSGVNGESGKVEGVAVQADRTLCFGALKTGVFFGDGIDHAGSIACADIGIELVPFERYAVLTDRELAHSLLPVRRRNAHKGSFGRAAIVAGSMEYSGAAYLAAAACLRSGVGYTVLFTPRELLPHYILKAPELLLKSISEGVRYAFSEENMRMLLAYDSVAYGMGMGMSEEVAKGAEWLLNCYEGKLILDADGLNSLAVYKKEELSTLFKNAKCDVLLTPHVKEFARLSGLELKELEDKGYSVVKAIAEQWGVTVLFKNAVSVITDGNRVAINDRGCSGQAKAGSGDVLSGVLVGLCASGMSAYDGAALGAYLTGLAAELAAEFEGEYSLTASDVIAYLGASFMQVQDGSLVTENADAEGKEE